MSTTILPNESLLQKIDQNDAYFEKLYPPALQEAERGRYRDAGARFAACYGNQSGASILSVPGRTELGGNHTDHNHGLGLTSAVNLDLLSVCSPRPDGKIELLSEGFAPISLDLQAAASPSTAEAGSTESLILGVADGFRQAGLHTGGFRAYVTSTVPKGSGLSSSAAFEVLIGSIFSLFYNENAVPLEQIAAISQYAENVWFQKPSGLMDQLACACGGILSLDFHDPSKPVLHPVPYDFTSSGYAMFLVDTQADHSNLTGEYASIPTEMKAVAKCFGSEVLRDVSEEAFYAALPRLREAVGDRACLRAAHFYAENKRVCAQVEALNRGDFPSFLKLVQASGISSYCYNQNVISQQSSRKQELAVALALSDHLLGGLGASRVQGGGFAGTIQAYVPLSLCASYCTGMEAVFGPGSTRRIFLRPVGVQVL